MKFTIPLQNGYLKSEQENIKMPRRRGLSLPGAGGKKVQGF